MQWFWGEIMLPFDGFLPTAQFVFLQDAGVYQLT
jgi:hypothetical protein